MTSVVRIRLSLRLTPAQLFPILLNYLLHALHALHGDIPPVRLSRCAGKRGRDFFKYSIIGVGGKYEGLILF